MLFSKLLYVLPLALPATAAPLEERKACVVDEVLALLKNPRLATTVSSFCSEWNRPTVTSSITLVKTVPAVATQTATSLTTVDTTATTTEYEPVHTIAAGQALGKRSIGSGPLGILAVFASSKISSACSCLVTSPSPAKVISKTVATSSATVTSTTTVLVTGTVTSTILSVIPSPSVAACSAAADTPGPGLTQVNLRIEGSTSTIFEGNVYCGPGYLDTPSGGNHSCNGLNSGANPQPGAVPSTCLAVAAAACGFPFDGTFQSEFDDFPITTIGGVSQTSTEFWGLLNNFQFAPVGGCEIELNSGDQVLWAFNAFNLANFLKLSVSTPTVAVGQSVTVKVVDGATGVNLAGAEVAGVTTDATGQATLTFSAPGFYSLKAERADSLRSNAVLVEVTA